MKDRCACRLTRSGYLSSEIASTRSGLTSLKAQIDAETSLAALKTEVRKIATDYRVYLLVVPQVNLVSGADTVGAAKPIFDKISANLTARIAAAKTAGKGTTAARPAAMRSGSALPHAAQNRAAPDYQSGAALLSPVGEFRP